MPKQTQLNGQILVEKTPDGGLVMAVNVSPFEQYVIQWDAAAARDHVKVLTDVMRGAKSLVLPDASLAVVGAAV